jgi:hypothetical protein
MNASISVIVPTYNRRRCLGRAIRSALAQARPNDEIIVIDDGSTDGSDEVVREFGDAIRYYYVRNGGAGRARNIGLDLATKDFVAFLDSDDEWCDGKLDLQRRLLDARPDVLFTFSDFAVTHKDGRAEHHYINKWLREPVCWDQAIGPARSYSNIAELPSGMKDFHVYIGDTAAALMINLFILTSSLMVRRIQAGDALRFAEDISVYEDWQCFAQLALLGKGAYLDCETTWQHGGAETRLSSAGALQRADAWNRLNQRVWERAPDFVAKHARLHAEAVARNALEMARGLMAAGRLREARSILAKNRYATIRDRVLSHLPSRTKSVLRSMRHVLELRGKAPSLSCGRR